MKRPSAERHQQEFIGGIKSKQRNIVFPDGLANGAAVDKFLLMGSPNAPLVQRVGAWIVGLTLLIGGIYFLGSAVSEKSLLMALISSGFFLVGAVVFRNGFRRRSSRERPRRI